MRRFTIWNEWQAEPEADGIYHVRKIGGYKIPGMAIGGNGCWFVQLAGEQWRQSYPSAREACAALVRRHTLAGVEAERQQHEWQPD
jgi:hypothetical protein